MCRVNTVVVGWIHVQDVRYGRICSGSRVGTCTVYSGSRVDTYQGRWKQLNSGLTKYEGHCILFDACNILGRDAFRVIARGTC